MAETHHADCRDDGCWGGAKTCPTAASDLLASYPAPQPIADVMATAVAANEAAGIPDPIDPAQYDQDERITNKPDLDVRCHVCRERKPMNGCVIIAISSGSGRAYRCPDCSPGAR